MELGWFAVFLSFITTLLIFGVNVFVISSLSRLFKVGKDFLNKKIVMKKSLKLAAIAAVVSFVLSIFATLFAVADTNIVLNIIFFLVNALVFILAGMKIFVENLPKMLVLWAFVFFIDFIAGILISAVLNALIWFYFFSWLSLFLFVMPRVMSFVLVFSLV